MNHRHRIALKIDHRRGLSRDIKTFFFFFPQEYLRFKAHVKHSVGLVEDHHRYPTQISHLKSGQDLVKQVNFNVTLISISQKLLLFLIIFIKSLVKNHY